MTIVERATILNARPIEEVDIGSNIVVNRDMDARIWGGLGMLLLEEDARILLDIGVGFGFRRGRSS